MDGALPPAACQIVSLPCIPWLIMQYFFLNFEHWNFEFVRDLEFGLSIR